MQLGKLHIVHTEDRESRCHCSASVCTQGTAVTVTLEYAAIHYFAHYRSWRYFGEEGEESITVEVSQRKHDNSTDIAICDTMRINDDGSLNIPNVNPRKHQGTWHCLDSQGNGATLDIRLQIAKGKKVNFPLLD